MSVKLKPVAEQVIVITGASSGIGLATARAAVKQGARVVLSSRNGEALGKIAADLGPKAMHHVVDVSDRRQVQALADAAIARFGGFDTWVNNAGLSIFGKLEQVSEEDHRRLFDINFWGLVHGSLVAVAHLKKRGGALINLGSVASDLVLPIQAMYSTTKHAVKGFTDGLRMELQDEGAPVSVTLIKPAAIDTPFTKHARNYMAEEPSLPAPVYPPELVADAILYAAATPVRDVYAGAAGKMMAAVQAVAPGVMDWLGVNVMGPQEKLSQPATSDRSGALHKPGADGKAHGGQPNAWGPTSFVATHPLLTGALLVGAGVVAHELLSSK